MYQPTASTVSLVSYGDGIHAIDAQFHRSRLAAIHFIEEDGEIAIIDTAHNNAAPRVLDALSQLGVTADAVRYIILTHIHLDHAGGAGTLMQLCPKATLVVHPRGVRHMIDPSRLMAGTEVVYGREVAQRRYGILRPVAQERILPATEGLKISIANRTLEFIDSPGHAAHHVTIFDQRTGHGFPGDTFGISYRELDQGNQQFVFPSTTPNQFDPDALHNSIRRICERQPVVLYPTHFSRIDRIIPLAERLHDLTDRYVEIARAARSKPQRKTVIAKELRALFHEEGQQQGYALSGAALDKLCDDDIELNAQGLDDWLVRTNVC